MVGHASRGALAAFVLVALGAGCALGACSRKGGGDDAPDASDAAAPDTDANASLPDAPVAADSSASVDATLSDGGADAADGAASGDTDATDALVTFPGADAGDCGVGTAGEPTDLACTGLYSDWAKKTVSPGLVEYVPGLVLWSDGATKRRWIYLPPGGTIDTSNMDEWVFPVGTRIWKEFSLPLGDGGALMRIETRLLWKVAAPSVWYRTTYRWSDDGTSAPELTTGELDAGGAGYEVPSQSQCDRCHNGRQDGVLGFEAVSLSVPGATGATIATLTSQGLLSAPPDASIVIPGSPVEAAALGWLHANCGTACHNNGSGAATTSGFYTRLDVATLASVQTTDTWTTGWNQQAQGFSIPGAPVSYRIHACDPGSSCAYYRASRRNGLDGTPAGIQMPPIDSHKVDEEGIEAVTAWINDGCDAGD